MRGGATEKEREMALQRGRDTLPSPTCMNTHTHTHTHHTDYADSYLQPEGVSQSQSGPPHRNSLYGSPRLLITALDLSRWRTILFRHCMGNLTSTPQSYLTFAFVSCLQSSYLTISRHWNPHGEYTWVHYAYFGVETFSWGIYIWLLAIIMCMCVYAPHSKWASVWDWPCEVMCDTGNCRLWWDIFLVSDWANTLFSSGFYFLVLRVRLSVCVTYRVFVWGCMASFVCVCVCVCVCVFVWRVKKWACQKWMIRLIRWNTADSRIKTHWRGKAQI